MNSNEKTLRVGVVGVGTMGRHHVRLVGQSPGVTAAGFYDPDPARAEEICRLYGCACFNTLDELMDRADALTVARLPCTPRSASAALKDAFTC